MVGLAFTTLICGQSRYLYSELVFLIPLSVVALRPLARWLRLLLPPLWLGACALLPLAEADFGRSAWIPLAEVENESRSAAEFYRIIAETPPEIGTIFTLSSYDSTPPEALFFLTGSERTFAAMARLTPICGKMPRDEISFDINGHLLLMHLRVPRCTVIDFDRLGPVLSDQDGTIRMVLAGGEVTWNRSVGEASPQISMLRSLLASPEPSEAQVGAPDGDWLDARVTLDRPIRVIAIDPFAGGRHRVWDFRP
jgi:hypothetical protein